jgi:hypothetical protein
MDPACEAGAIIVIVAILLPLLIYFIVLAVDSTLFAVSREQAQHTARLACLAALEAHFAEGQSSVDARLASALQRSRDVTETNLLLSNNEGYDNPENARRISLVGQGTERNEAVLTPGTWYYDLVRSDDLGHPLATPENRCFTGDSPPCFVPYDPSRADGINAYRLRGRLYAGFRTKLTGLFGFPDLQADATTICAVGPRHYAVKIDLSPSMHRETHVLRSTASQQSDPQGGRGSEFAFFLVADNNSQYGGTLPRTGHDTH